MKMIIEAEVKRAEALIERYMGLPPESIDLYNFNADALRKAPVDLGRAISALRQVAAKNSPSQSDEAYAVNAVDLIAALTRGPQLPAPILKLWEVEESIRNAGGLWTLKHLVTIALGFAGVLVGSTNSLSLGYEMFAYVALALIVGSGALHLTHSKNAEMEVPVYTFGGLAVFCVLNAVYAPSIGFLVLLVCAIAFMVGSFISLLADGKSSATGSEFHPEAYEPSDVLRTEEYNLYKVTVGNDMSEPIDRLS
ncbi:hypothetical protein [Pseudomonas psychrophila]|uniref:Uncharacterized protein n=1 Tax=Pseudomonas psychrophila TaxID=122355 RepID=A0A8I1KAY4_9PSED|nr:hypothetical protein [Pseudomonas psychrophila]AVX93275.1 hypothetical protein PkP19E3_34650 [Pseudomonas koreensis]MBJ2259168.1 hypothetical protein [Pseudomonas psychrophila]